MLLLLWNCQKDDRPVGREDPEVPSSVTVSPQTAVAEAGGGSFVIEVVSPSRPAVSGLPDWISLQDGTYNPATFRISYPVTVASNVSFAGRTAVLTFSAGSQSASLSITQHGLQRVDKTNLSKLPVNANATENAKKLYSVLYEIYGERTISGVQSSMSNENDYLDAVYAATGSHPALSGYDFIFLHYSPTPAGWSWRQDYTDISAQKEHWTAGGIVSYMWHWNVPESESVFRSGGTDGYGFYVSGSNSQTDFDIREAVKEGTWQHECILANIDKMAVTLKLLQDEGIPILFRPLHEAAGNYTRYNSAGGAWFWWGKHGASYCRKLWNIVQDRLQQYHGLNNILWVWTADVMAGYEQAAAEWYPGDDRVDIIGFDVYEENTGEKRLQYGFLQDVFQGRKMFAVSECGNIPSPEKNLLAGYPWLWFMVWPTSDAAGKVNIYGYSLNTADYWNRLMKSDYVYTRENMRRID